LTSDESWSRKTSVASISPSLSAMYAFLAIVCVAIRSTTVRGADQ
jgi:hypothetical protein